MSTLRCLQENAAAPLLFVHVHAGIHTASAVSPDQRLHKHSSAQKIQRTSCVLNR
jgi:hypothetical protein